METTNWKIIRDEPHMLSVTNANVDLNLEIYPHPRRMSDTLQKGIIKLLEEDGGVKEEMAGCCLGKVKVRNVEYAIYINDIYIKAK